MWWRNNKSRSAWPGRGNRRTRRSQEPVLMVKLRMAGQKKETRQRMMSVFLLTLVLVGLVWLGLMGTQSLGRLLFTDNQTYLIQHLDFSSDGRLNSGHLREYAGGIKEGMNLFCVDLQMIKKNLESVPLIKSAEVRRRLPDTLEVRVQERQALAQLGSGLGGLPLSVDREGYVLGPSSRTPQLPAIKGFVMAGLKPGSFVGDAPAVADALKLLDLCDTTRLGDVIKVETVQVQHEEYMEMDLAGGETVRLARHDLPTRLDKIASILAESEQKNRPVASIDATGDNNFPVRHR